MKKRSFFPLLIIISVGLLGGLSWRIPQDKKDIQAFVLKVVNDVQKKAPTSGWQKAVLLDGLKSGYEVRTEPKSLALIKFMDETKLVVREKSIVTIQGEVKGKEILNRNVHMTRGQVNFNVTKGENEQFRFSSPISVASIRGTVGGFRAGEDSTDILIIKIGFATHTNLLSNRSTDVGAGETSIADGKGNMNKRNSTSNEQGSLGDEAGSTDTTGTQAEVTILGSTSFDPPPAVGTASVLKIDLSQTAATINGVTASYRMKGAADWKSLTMQLQQKVASATIPADDVTAGSIEYYFTVNHSDNKTATLPNGGASDPASVAVTVPVAATSGNVTINATPAITPSPLVSLMSASVRLDLSSVDRDIDLATLYYRRPGGSFQSGQMTLSGKVASGQIPGASVLSPQIEYYFIVKIKNGPEVTLPADGASNPSTLAVTALDLTYEFGRISALTNISGRLDLSAIQTPLSGLSIYTRSGDQPSFTQTQTTLSGTAATFTIPGNLVRTPRLDYYLSARLPDGLELLFPRGGESSPRGMNVTPISLTPVFSQLTSGRQATVRVDLGQIQANLQTVTLYHKKQNDATFKQLQMTLAAGRVATAQIEGENIGFPVLQSYIVIRLTDGTELMVPDNGVSSPRSDPVTPVRMLVRVEGEDKDGIRRVVYIEVDK